MVCDDPASVLQNFKMKQIGIAIFFVFFSIVSLSLKAQSGYSDTRHKLSTRKNLLGINMYFTGDVRLSVQEFERILKRNEEAYAVYEERKKFVVLEFATGLPGGFIAGREIRKAIERAEPNKVRAFTGGALIIVSLLSGSLATQSIRDAIDIYNYSDK